MNDFFSQALVFIFISVLMVPLTKKLGLGSVLGYLLAGLIIGPFGLKFIKDPERILHFSEVGVVILLFVIGLEMNPKKLWGMRFQLFGLGSLQILITTVIIYFILLFFNIESRVAFWMSFAFSLSSTAYAIQTLNEKKQFNTIFGQSSFSILLMQDIAAIPALALIPFFFLSSDSPSAKISIFPILVVFIGLFLVSRYFIRPLFRIVASSNSKEIFTALALFIVLGVATLMQNIGLSAALGTFIAGLLLAESEYRHELEASIDPFKSLLMGLFFISVGMSVPLDLLKNNFFTYFSLTIGYLAIKIGVIYFSGLIFRLKKLSSFKMALTIAQGGEFAFVLFSLILKNNSNYSELIAGGTIVITLSMILNPLLFYIAELFIQKSLQNKSENYDAIQNTNPEVIIVGFGRMGQMFGRLLKAQNIPFTAIDYNAEQVELVRRFGNKVYFGDATRIELLEAAGVDKAKYFVNSIGQVDMSIELTRQIKTRYPHLKLFCRARNRNHVFKLMELGVDYIRRETFDSSLVLAQQLLKEMGQFNSEQIVQLFTAHDEEILLKQFEVHKDESSLLSVTQQGALQLEEVLKMDATPTSSSQ